MNMQFSWRGMTTGCAEDNGKPQKRGRAPKLQRENK